jgi:hypothetical protein
MCVLHIKVTNGSVILSGLTMQSSGTLTLENNATLLQSLYQGQILEINVKRNTSPVLQFDATFGLHQQQVRKHYTILHQQQI